MFFSYPLAVSLLLLIRGDILRHISVNIIRDIVASLYGQAAAALPSDILDALQMAMKQEQSRLGIEMLTQICQNANLAQSQRTPICQDTGLVIVFLKIGQEVHFTDGDLQEAINEGVRMAVQEAGLRASVVSPLTRINTKDNTPAILHLEIVAGDEVEIIVFPKGFGSENMSRLFMLTPAAGEQGVLKVIVQTVKEAGGNPCPPVIVGVGIGGTSDHALLMAKRALLRPIGENAARDYLVSLEKQALQQINSLGIGPMGLGGRITALAVHINEAPTHIAGLPVAICLQCHAARQARAIIS